eukprot:2947613-Amphidinium_carterae.1
MPTHVDGHMATIVTVLLARKLRARRKITPFYNKSGSSSAWSGGLQQKLYVESQRSRNIDISTDQMKASMGRVYGVLLALDLRSSLFAVFTVVCNDEACSLLSALQGMIMSQRPLAKNYYGRFYEVKIEVACRVNAHARLGSKS